MEKEIKHIIESNAEKRGFSVEADDDLVVRLASFVERAINEALSVERKRIAEEVEKLCNDNNNAQGELWEFTDILREIILKHS